MKIGTFCLLLACFYFTEPKNFSAAAAQTCPDEDVCISIVQQIYGECIADNNDNWESCQDFAQSLLESAVQSAGYLANACLIHASDTYDDRIEACLQRDPKYYEDCFNDAYDLYISDTNSCYQEYDEMVQNAFDDRAEMSGECNAEALAGGDQCQVETNEGFAYCATLCN